MTQLTPRYLLIFLFLLSLTGHASNLTFFGQDDIDQWETESFRGETRYQLVDLDGHQVLNAQSSGTASALFIKTRIDLYQTPFLTWRWKVSSLLPEMNHKTEEGDDYAARIYVVFERGFFGMDSKALNYVWSSSVTAGSEWDNAFSGPSVKMISVRGNDAKAGVWYAEKRNVLEDVKRIFGHQNSGVGRSDPFRYVDVIAVMTDTDNTNSSVESFYSDIEFTDH